MQTLIQNRSKSDNPFCILHYTRRQRSAAPLYGGAHFVVTVIGAAVDVVIVGMRNR